MSSLCSVKRVKLEDSKGSLNGGKEGENSESVEPRPEETINS